MGISQKKIYVCTPMKILTIMNDPLKIQLSSESAVRPFISLT